MNFTINNVEYSVEFSEDAGEVSISHGNSTSTLEASSAEDGMERFVKSQLRRKRDKLLTESDWRMVSDYPLDDQEEWKTYRQSLRDLPNNYILGEDVSWPVRP